MWFWFVFVVGAWGSAVSAHSGLTLCPVSVCVLLKFLNQYDSGPSRALRLTSLVRHLLIIGRSKISNPKPRRFPGGGELTRPQDGNIASHVLDPRVSRHALGLLLRGQKWHSHVSMC